MDSKSLEVLEFAQIKEILAGFTSFSASRALALDLEPSADYGGVSLLLNQATEGRRLLALEPSFGIGGITDIREAAEMAARGKLLEPQVLVEIGDSLSSLDQLRDRLERLSGEFPLLWDIVQGITKLGPLEKDIARCLTPKGELLDSASSKLSAVRKQLKQARQQLLERLKATLESPRGRKIAQEPIITEREGRYVIPVRIEFKKEIKGIVHDISDSGATIFVEPWTTVEMGNTLRELVIEESREIERILGTLSAAVGGHQAEIAQNVALAAKFDLVMAKARYARQARGSESVLTEFREGAGTLRLAEARHPLLGGKAVPLSVEIGRDFSTLVITGPNTGGKTVALKTVGLLSLMAQAGIPIPALPETTLPVFDNIFADIGDEQSIEQTLSTFSWHMGNIVRITNKASEKSLVLLDELGTNTDPVEGSALARAVLLHFLSQGTMSVVTTHYSDLKAFAHVTPGLQNASLDLDPATMLPTYHLRVGIPGGSNALTTAARLGLPDQIIETAKNMLSRDAQELERLLADLVEEKQKAESLGEELKKERDEAAQRNAELDKELQRLKTEERKAIQEARDGVVRQAAELHQEIRRAATALRKERKQETIEQAKRALAAVREELKSQAWQPKASGEATDEGKITVGDVVWLKEANLPATVLSISEETQQIEVQAGQVKLRLALNGVEKAGGAPTPLPESIPVKRPPRGQPVPLELDLRGKRADEVEWALDRHLNAASLAGLAEVRIIHGGGTGAIRQTVRELLSSHPLAKSFRPGGRGEGGDGATVVRL